MQMQWQIAQLSFSSIIETKQKLLNKEKRQQQNNNHHTKYVSGSLNGCAVFCVV